MKREHGIAQERAFFDLLMMTEEVEEPFDSRCDRVQCLTFTATQAVAGSGELLCVTAQSRSEKRQL